MSPEPAPRRSFWRRLIPRTLAARLTTGVAVLVAAVVAVVGTATYAALKVSLTRRLDEQLTSVSEDTAGAAYRSLGRCLAFPCALQLGQEGVHGPSQQWIAVIIGTEAMTLTLPSNSGFETLNVSGTQLAALARNPGQPRTLNLQTGQTLRVVAVSQPSGVIVVTGLSTEEVTTTLHRLVVLELFIGGGAVLIAFLLTTWGVRLSLRELNKVTRTAQEVTAELSSEGAGLDRRVPVAEVDTEVGRLASSVNTLLGSVEYEFAARVESESRMRQFLADASHELRTPLTSIRGYAELARMRREAGTSESAAASADALDRIESEGTRMSRLVEDLLILARSDQGAELHAEPVALDDLADVTVAGARASYPMRTIRTDVAPGLVIWGDHDQLLRVLRNLLTNAAIHTRTDGEIVLGARSEGATAVVTVADEGPGLPPEDAAQVFGRFWRADKARARVNGGSGLGLSIVASIIAAHHGSVRFDSSPEAGSVVTLTLPLAQPVPAAGQSGDPHLPGEAELAPCPPSTPPVPSAQQELLPDPAPPARAQR